MKVELEYVLDFIENYKNEQTVSKYAKVNECREVRVALDRLLHFLEIEFDIKEN